MPHMDGMELAKKIRTTNNKMIIVFTTNLINFAIKGYEVEALDYLVKPINKNHLFKTLDKISYIMKTREDKFVTLKNKTAIKVVPANSITYIEIHSHLISYHFMDGTTFDVWGTLKEEMSKLPENEYVRINSSEILNMQLIKSLNNNEVSINGVGILYISRLFKKTQLRKSWSISALKYDTESWVRNLRRIEIHNRIIAWLIPCLFHIFSKEKEFLAQIYNSIYRDIRD